MSTPNEKLDQFLARNNAMVRATTLTGFCEKVMQPANADERQAALVRATEVFDSGKTDRGQTKK